MRTLLPPWHSLLPLLGFAGLGLSCSADADAATHDEVEPSHLRFVDVTAGSGIEIRNVSGDPRRWYLPESNGSGAAWLDFDGDGDMDLFVANGARLDYQEDGARLVMVNDASCRLFRNDGNLKFRDVTSASGADRSDWVNAVATGDVDNDGDAELYLGCFGKDVLLTREAGRYRDTTEQAGLGNPLLATGATFGDPDRDGDLDLYVANYCLFDLQAPPMGGKRNVVAGVEVAWGPVGENGRGLNPGAPDVYYRGDGKGGFREATEGAGLVLDEALASYAAVFGDVDDDGWPDLMVANDIEPANLFMNRGDGTFRDEAVERGFAFTAEGNPTSAMGLFVDDVDMDGDFDVLRTNFDFEPNSLHLNDGQGRFEERTRTSGLAEPSTDRLGWGGGFFDADLDGDLDLLVANGHVYPQAEEIEMHPWAQVSQLFEAVPHRKYRITWEDVTARSGSGLAAARSARGVALGDPDNDGDIDALIVDMDENPRLLENRSVRYGEWVAVRTVGTISNRDGYGAKVTVVCGPRRFVREVRTAHGLYSAHDPRVFFGLGAVDKIDRIEIRWPSGMTQVVEHPALNRLHVIEESNEDR